MSLYVSKEGKMFRHFFIIGSILLLALSACAGLGNGTVESTTNSPQSINAEQGEVTDSVETTEEVEATDGEVESTEPVATDSDSDTITEESSEESTNEEPRNEYAAPNY